MSFPTMRFVAVHRQDGTRRRMVVTAIVVLMSLGVIFGYIHRSDRRHMETAKCK